MGFVPRVIRIQSQFPVGMTPVTVEEYGKGSELNSHLVGQTRPQSVFRAVTVSGSAPTGKTHVPGGSPSFIYLLFFFAHPQALDIFLSHFNLGVSLCFLMIAESTITQN